MSQAFGSPAANPALNQRTRCSDVPCVNASGTTRPPDCFCNRSSPIALAVLRVSGLPLIRHWHVVHRRARVLSPVAEALRYFLIETGNAFLQRHFASLKTYMPAPAARKPVRRRKKELFLVRLLLAVFSRRILDSA